jgi:formylglycine-generating enzyme required for sulfatase activity/predicted phosphodiesterase
LADRRNPDAPRAGRSGSPDREGRRLTWLHISDWHQKQAPDFDRGVVLEALLADIAARADISSDLAAIDFIVFSGDVAHGGQEQEYEAVVPLLLDPLLRASAVERSRLFIVAGNHDVDREAFELLPQDLLQPFATSEEAVRWLTDPRRLARLHSPFEAYARFVEVYLGRRDAAGAYAEKFEVGGTTVGLAGFNSAVMSGRNRDQRGEVVDYGFLVVGEPEVHRSLRDIADAEVRLAVLHHPFSWLARFEASRTEERLCRDCHFILYGHQHEASVNVVGGTSGDCLIVPAGATYDRRKADDPRYVNAYNFTHIELDRGVGTIYLRRWSDRRNKWIADEDTHPGGQFEFKVPKSKKVVEDPPPPVKGRGSRSPAPRGRPVRYQDKEFVPIPAGLFVMGSTDARTSALAAQESRHPFDNECPRHEVELAGYLISRYPVTNGEYEAFVRTTGRAVPYREDAWSRKMNWDPQARTFPAGKAEHPVVLVSWEDARAYCAWFGARLPTEAEWEKAARGDDGREWPWGNAWQADRCNSDNLNSGTMPVGHFGPRGESVYGAADMVGNVWEWCSSHLDPYPYFAADGREAMIDVGKRVQRGGAWSDNGQLFARCAVRAGQSSQDFGFNIGFRLVRDLPVARSR